MPRRYWIAIASIAAIVMAIAWLIRPKPQRQIVDLVQTFPTAKRQPSAEAFTIQPVTIDAETKLSIVAREQTRLTYHVTIPRTARLHVALALHPTVWNAAGDGVLFLVGISDGRVYRTLYSTVVAPHEEPGGRRWRKLSLSLEEYAGLTIDIVLNTRAGLGPQADLRGDLAVWGAPGVTANRPQ